MLFKGKKINTIDHNKNLYLMGVLHKMIYHSIVS